MSKIPDLSRIKYAYKDHRSEAQFGDVERYHSEAKKYWAQGFLIISNPITGELDTIKYDEIDIEKMGYGWDKQDPDTRLPITNDYELFINEAYKTHKRVSKNAGKGLAKGKLFSIGVADGYAHYVVTKVNKKTVRVEWRGFGGDNYVDQVLGYGATFSKDIIEPLVRREEAMAKMFG